MKHSTIISAVIGIAIAVTALIAYAIVSYNFLNVNFSIQSNAVIVRTSNLYLGVLYLGQNGSASLSTNIKVNQGGLLTFVINNYAELQPEFSYFVVSISFYNSTQYTVINIGWPYNGLSDTVYLAPGTYNLYVQVTYTVAVNATPMNFTGNLVTLEYTK